MRHLIFCFFVLLTTIGTIGGTIGTIGGTIGTIGGAIGTIGGTIGTIGGTIGTIGTIGGTIGTIGIIGGCSKPKKIVEFGGMTMGTTYSIKVAHGSFFNQEHTKRQISNILKKVNAKMSTYIEDSDISKFNNLQSSEPFSLDPWLHHVLKFSLSVAKLTKGVYDPTVGPLVNLWGFGPTERRSFPSDKEISEIKSIVGYEKLSFKKKGDIWLIQKSEPRTYVDLSSAAKGYAVDKLAEFLRSEGIEDFLVEVGGEIRAHGKKFDKSWIVAIEKPGSDKRAVYRSFPLENMSIATSGSYRNFFKSGSKVYSHTIDAITGKPIEHKMISVTVLNESCMKADAFATALMVLGPERAKHFAEEHKLAVYFIYKKNSSTQDGEAQFKAQSEAQSEAQFESQSEAQFEGESKGESKGEFKVQLKGESKAQLKGESKAQLKGESKAQLKMPLVFDTYMSKSFKDLNPMID